MKKLITLFTALLLFGSMTVVQAYTFSSGTKIYYNLTEYGGGINPYAPGSNSWEASTANIIEVTLNNSWTVNAGTKLFKSGAGGNWADRSCSSAPTAGQNMIISTDGINVTWGTYVYTPPTIILKGGFNGWGDSDVFTDNGSTATFTKTISAGTYGMKIMVNGQWKNNATTIQRANSGTEYDFSGNEGSDCSLVADINGDYTFTYTYATKKLSVTFPSEPVVLPPATIKLHSNITNPSWESSAAFTLAGNEETASLTLTSVAKGSYEFGVKINESWTSNGSAFTRANPSHAITSGSGNCTFNADRNGDYTFTWTYATNTLEIGYPAIPAQSVTFTSLASQILKGSVINLANCVESSGIDEPTYRFYIKEKNGEYGDAINANYNFNANGEYVVKVEALEYGEPVASDESNVVVYQSYTFTNGSTIYVDFSAMTEGSKGVNYPKANEVGLDYDAAGAGTIKTVTFSANVTWNTMAEVFIKTEKAGWANLPFIVPGTGQNCAVVAADGASYTWDTYVPAPPTIKMHGNFLGDWATTDAFVVAGNNETASLEMTINTKGAKEFGMRIGSDDNWTSNGAAITRASASAEIVSGSGNCSLNADIPGEYIFTWTYASNTLSVTYPDLPTQYVEFDELSEEILKGTAVDFAATATGVTNPVYTYYVKPAGGEYGSAVTSYTFNAEGSFTVKVSVEGDNTVEPVVAEQTVVVYDAHTFAEGQKIYIDFTAMTEGEKGVNYPSAGAASAGAYDAAGAGKFLTVTFTTDVTWSTLSDFIKTEKGDWDPGMKFTVPADGQNWVKVAADGASYTWDTYVDLTTEFYLVGSLVGWDPLEAYRFMKATVDATEASTTVNITEYSNITFKLKENGEWRSCEGTVTLDKDHNTVTIANENGNNIGMIPFAAGDYIFTLNLSTRELTVTYPDGEAMPIPQNIFLACDKLNNWAPANPDYKFTVDEDLATLEVTLAENTDYAFKLVHNGSWYGANYNFNYYWNTDVQMVYEATQANLNAFKAGTYTFEYTISTNKLTIHFKETDATEVAISQYEYATLYSATGFDVPDEVEAYIITGLDGIHLTTERIYRIPANTGVLLHAPQGNYDFYEGDSRYMGVDVSANMMKGTVADQEINNELVHYILSLNSENVVGLYWPYGTSQGVGSYENKAGKAYLEIPAASQPQSVVARRGFPLSPGAGMPTGIEMTNDQLQITNKRIVNGQLYIILDGATYNAQGARVQ